MTESDDALDTDDARAEALRALREAREYATWKSSGDGRITDDDRAKTRIQYMKVVVQAANAERRLLKDRELEQLEERLERIERIESHANRGTPAAAVLVDDGE